LLSSHIIIDNILQFFIPATNFEIDLRLWWWKEYRRTVNLSPRCKPDNFARMKARAGRNAQLFVGLCSHSPSLLSLFSGEIETLIPEMVDITEYRTFKVEYGCDLIIKMMSVLQVEAPFVIKNVVKRVRQLQGVVGKSLESGANGRMCSRMDDALGRVIRANENRDEREIDSKRIAARISKNVMESKWAKENPEKLLELVEQQEEKEEKKKKTIRRPAKNSSCTKQSLQGGGETAPEMKECDGSENSAFESKPIGAADANDGKKKSASELLKEIEESKEPNEGLIRDKQLLEKENELLQQALPGVEQQNAENNITQPKTKRQNKRKKNIIKSKMLALLSRVGVDVAAGLVAAMMNIKASSMADLKQMLGEG
jgi:hypothetical protein